MGRSMRKFRSDKPHSKNLSGASREKGFWMARYPAPHFEQTNITVIGGLILDPSQWRDL